jgi:hypothetical protein
LRNDFKVQQEELRTKVAAALRKFGFRFLDCTGPVQQQSAAIRTFQSSDVEREAELKGVEDRRSEKVKSLRADVQYEKKKFAESKSDWKGFRHDNWDRTKWERVYLLDAQGQRVTEDSHINNSFENMQ